MLTSNLYPPFPGFGEHSPLPISLAFSQQRCKAVSEEDLIAATAGVQHNQAVTNVAELFIEAMEYIVQKSAVDVLICAPPKFLTDILDDLEDVEDEAEHISKLQGLVVFKQKLIFHDYLKAKAMRLRRPVQYIRQTTYDIDARKQRKKRRSGFKNKALQDDATCAWNIYLALYYRSGATPWRMPLNPYDYPTCYVGLAFYQSLDKSKLLTSTAQIFNERGYGHILRGAPAKLDKDDRQPHLAEEDAATLMERILHAYKQEHDTMPTRFVMHKSSKYTDCEFNGFKEVLKSNRVNFYDFLNLDDSYNRTRLYRNEYYPPLRGTMIELDEVSHVLYTFGSIDFYKEYPGMYVPKPLKFKCEFTQQTSTVLAQEILALTKMNWNSSRFENSRPITLKAAREVGAILKYLNGEEDIVEYFYRYYM